MAGYKKGMKSFGERHGRPASKFVSGVSKISNGKKVRRLNVNN